MSNLNLHLDYIKTKHLTINQCRILRNLSRKQKGTLSSYLIESRKSKLKYSNDDFVIIAENNGKVIGWLLATRSDPDLVFYSIPKLLRKSFYIGIYISKKYRRNNIAFLIVRFAFQFSNKFIVYVEKNEIYDDFFDKRAQSFFNKFNYKRNYIVKIRQ